MCVCSCGLGLRLGCFGGVGGVVGCVGMGWDVMSGVWCIVGILGCGDWF